MTRPPPLILTRRTPRSGTGFAWAIAISLAIHLALLPLLLLPMSPASTFFARTPEFDVISITLDALPPPQTPDSPPEPSPGPVAGPPPAAMAVVTRVAPTPLRPATRAARPVPPDVATVIVGTEPAPVGVVDLGEAELVGATRAGPASGSEAGTASGPGGRCDMVRRLQDALRADADVQRAAATAHRALGRGRALILWNGDWLQSPGQAGRGLAGVRQAIALEIAFAPPACLRQAMRGLVLITMDDTPDSPRIALGTARWRWSELSGGS